MADPGAGSAAIQDISFTSGTGSYTLDKGIAGKNRIENAYSDGAAITVYVTDTSQMEVVTGVYSAAANTISRATLVMSSTGGLINWPTTGQRIVTPIASAPTTGGVFYISFSIGGKFSQMGTDPWDGNYEIFDVEAPVPITFPANFSTSPAPGCEVAGSDTWSFTLQSIHAGTPTARGFLTIAGGALAGSYSVPAGFTVPAGDRLRLSASSSIILDSTLAGVFGTIVGTR